MRGLILLIALGTSACERQPQSNAAMRSPDSLEPSVPAQSSKPAPVVPMPRDQQQLDRMILAGYTPHGNHLHPPGVKECPLAQGTDAIM